MKKLTTFIIALAAFVTLQAQWVNDPVNNTFLANTSADAGEVYLSTSPDGTIYAQWSQFGPNSWSPTIQKVSPSGEPGWDAAGIHPSYHQMASWSQGFAMTATSDGDVVTCFATEANNTIAIKINADGTYAWGEQGLTLFDGAGNSRTELLAGDDGGVWALGTDVDNGNLYVCYIEADGTLNPTITISDNTGKLCMFGLMVPAPDNNVFVVYEKEQWAYTYFYEKDIRVVSYSKDGTQISDDVQLMSPVTIPGSYIHYVVPDGIGGGYVYIWHAGGQGGSFNTYVFHFNANGISTILEPNGMPVHKPETAYYYLDANATVDPVSHDLLITYIETDAEFQALCKLYVNRITSTGVTLWDDGIVVLNNGTNPCNNLLIDAHPYGTMFSLIYNDGDYQSTVKAKGFDMDCNELWSTTMSSQAYPRTMCKNTTGFTDNTQNVVTWINSSSGGLYGQNIGWDGSMGGNITPPTPPTPCYPPTNFQGFYSYDPQCSWYGAELTWTASESLPLLYRLYREDVSTSTTEIIEIDATATEYIDNVEIGDYIYRLTALYEDCESDYALTANGDDYIIIEVTSVPENEYETIVNVIDIYNINGQRTNTNNLEELNQGIYIIKGVTETGKTVIRKIVK